MSMRLLHAISNETELSIPRTAEHDVESFCWVIIYVVYRHTIEDKALRARNSTLHEEFEKEFAFAWIFSATNPGDLVDTRRSLLTATNEPSSPHGIQNLVDYYIDNSETPLAGLLLNVWRRLRKAATFNRAAPSLPIYKQLLERVDEAYNREMVERGEQPQMQDSQVALQPPAQPVRHEALISSLKVTLSAYAEAP